MVFWKILNINCHVPNLYQETYNGLLGIEVNSLLTAQPMNSQSSFVPFNGEKAGKSKAMVNSQSLNDCMWALQSCQTFEEKN